MLLVSGCDGLEVHELTEAALDEVQIAVEGAESGWIDPVRQGFDIGPGTSAFIASRSVSLS